MLIGVEEDLEKLFPLEVLFFSKFGFWLSTCLGSFLVDAVSQSHEAWAHVGRPFSLGLDQTR